MRVIRWQDGALSLRIGRRFQLNYEPRRKPWHPMDAHLIRIGRRELWWTR